MKNYDKSFQDRASVWWFTLSIEEREALEKKYKTSYRASASEVAAIYDQELLGLDSAIQNWVNNHV